LGGQIHGDPNANGGKNIHNIEIMGWEQNSNLGGASISKKKKFAGWEIQKKQQPYKHRGEKGKPGPAGRRGEFAAIYEKN